jgi:adenosylcobinamide-phosphate synthase
VRYRPELGTGDDADADYMRAAVGLIWRALVTWMFLMFVVTLAYSLG